MDRIKIWLIPGIIVILAIGALIYFRGQLPDPAAPAVQVKTEVEVTRPKGFVQPPEPSAQKKAEADALAMAQALKSDDLSACAKITWNEVMRKQCEDNLNYSLILKGGDESQCKVINDEILKKQCYDKVYMSKAIDLKDTDLCKKIADPVLMQLCLDQVLMVLAHSATSASDCASISSAILRKQCEDNYYYKSSAREMDTAGCNSINNPQLAEQCRTTVAKNVQAIEVSKRAAANATVTRTSKEILVMCDSLTGEKVTMCKDAVFPKLAFDEKDLSYCSNISNQLKVNECVKEQTEKINTYFLRQAIALQDKSLCNKILDTELKQVCQSS